MESSIPSKHNFPEHVNPNASIEHTRLYSIYLSCSSHSSFLISILCVVLQIKLCFPLKRFASRCPEFSTFVPCLDFVIHLQLQWCFPGCIGWIWNELTNGFWLFLSRRFTCNCCHDFSGQKDRSFAVFYLILLHLRSCLCLPTPYLHEYSLNSTFVKKSSPHC